MQTSFPSQTHAGRRPVTAAALVLALTVVLAALSTSHAYAAEGSQYGSIGQYGEVTRFGGFDTTAYDNGSYEGTLTPGKFLNPVGFAVDPDDTEAGGTAVYVLDRVSDWPETTTLTQGTEWRLQKLSDTGAVLGTTIFYLPKTVVKKAEFEVSVGLVGLAVNHAAGQIYTVLYETTGKKEEATQYAYEVIGWSTTPVSKKLVAAGTSADKVSEPVQGYSAAGLISNATQLEATPVYEPDGLTTDTTGGKSYVAIEGDSAKRNESGLVEGPATVEQVSTENGDETDSWSAASLSSAKNASSADVTALAAGISTNANGDLSVLLSTGHTQLDAIDLSADLTDPKVIASEGSDTPNEWAGALQIANAASPTPDPSAPAVELSNGLYASDFRSNGTEGYWNKAQNEGIRLLEPSATEGLLSNPQLPPTTIFDTLGNETQGEACYLGDEGVSAAENNVTLAAGAQGSIWILTSGDDSSSGDEPATETGRYVIELAPNAANSCVKPTGTFTVADKTLAEPKAEPASTNPADELTIPVGHTVEFNASPIEYPTSAANTQGAIYAYEWAPTGTGYTIVDDTQELHQPEATASYQYTVPGVYNVELKLLGDFGEYDEDGTIVVQTTSPPAAAFKVPATAQTGQAVSFNASESRPAGGAQISDYHWSFGDGATDDTQSAADTHSYTASGVYTVTLTVRDNDGQSSTPVSQTITVSNPPSSGGGNTGGGATTTPLTTAPTGPPVAKIDRSATDVSPKAVESSSGNTVITVSCPSIKVSCAGTVEVKTAGAVIASASKSAKAKKKVLVLGQASFSLTGGQRETLTIKLSPAGAMLLKKDRSLKVDVVVAAHDSYGDPLTETLTLTLKEPSTKKSVRKK
jgi:PKD repeat protein